ncbi:hypothetical protein Btru_010961 [Bulinus truncatus]|nr:hypothetical protein Btru_010961 [Bulinus truncatus]
MLASPTLLPQLALLLPLLAREVGSRFVVPPMNDKLYIEEGDLVIGGIFSITERDHMSPCSDRVVDFFRIDLVESMVFSIREINQILLPDLRIGFVVADACNKETTAALQALRFLPKPHEDDDIPVQPTNNNTSAMERERERNAYHAMLIQKLQDGDMLQVPYKNDIFKHYLKLFSMTNKTVFHRNDVPGVDNTRSLRKIFWGDNNFSIQESSFESQTRECFAQLYTDLDPWFKPLEGSKIIKEAQGKLGKRGYNLFSKNCEHFANQCRINIRICQQMINVFYWTWMIHFTILVTLEMCELYTNYTRNFLPENCNRYYHRIVRVNKPQYIDVKIFVFANKSHIFSKNQYTTTCICKLIGASQACAYHRHEGSFITMLSVCTTVLLSPLSAKSKSTTVI